MQNRGFFHASVTGDTIVSEKKKTVKFSFEATTGPQYKINEINFPPDTTEAISKEIVRSKRRTLLKPGNPYDLDMIKAEHGRIDLWLKNRGYYYFNPGYLLTRVDSGRGEHKVDMYVKLKEVTPDNDKQPYRINNIWVYPTYSIEADSMLSEAPSKRFEDYNIIDPDNVFKPQVFKRMLIFHPGDVYSRRDHNLSLNRLVNLGCGAGSYNGMNSARLEVDNKWAQVQSAYQRRADLIPNLVSTVKGAAEFEKSTYVQVAQARAGNLVDAAKVSADELTPEKLAAIQKANAEAQQAMRMAINIAVERYPDLKATQNFSGLQTQLEGTENRINLSRNEFNEAVKSFNLKVTNFPGNIMAGIFGFKQKPMFQSDPGAEKAPQVQF
ncbi:LemA family protein [Ostertagia ostertagi]